MTQNGQEYAATKVAGSVTNSLVDSGSDSPMEVVVRAAAWLDSKVGMVVGPKVWPADWRDQINTDTLSLEHGDTCVIGQPLGCKTARIFEAEANGEPWDCGGPWLLDDLGGYDPEPFSTDLYREAWVAYVTATRGQAMTETSSDLGAKPNNPTSPPTTDTTCGQTRTRSPEVLERVTANV